MKIFPPISEMIWPPGRSTAQMLWGHRYILLAVVGVLGAVIVWPALQAPTAPEAQPTNVASPTPVRANAGAAPAAPPKRGATPALQGTLTAADRAIVAPSARRSGEGVRVPPLALTPTPN